MEEKEHSILILGAISLIAVIGLTALLNAEMTGQYMYQDKIRLVTETRMPPTPGIQPNIPTIDYRYQKRQVHWIEGNRAYNILGSQTYQQAPIQAYPIIYEKPAWAEYYIIEPIN